MTREDATPFVEHATVALCKAYSPAFVFDFIFCTIFHAVIMMLTRQKETQKGHLLRKEIHFLTDTPNHSVC